MCLKLLEERASEAQLDLDALSGLTEIDLEVEENIGLKNIMRLGVSLRPSVSKVVSTQLVSLNPRHVVSNESEEVITIRQCYLEVSSIFNYCLVEQGIDKLLICALIAIFILLKRMIWKG